jgi:TonB-linked SusC/RagA family outer membrane protein
MRRLFTTLVCGAALLLLTPGLATAQDTGTIEGTVTDASTGDSLPGATVQVLDEGIGSATDANGEYTIQDVPAGEQQLRIQFVGYQTATRSINVSAGETTTVNVQLAPGDIELEDVIVTAKGVNRQERSLGYSVSNVTSEDLTRADSENLVNALSGKVSGVEITSQSGNVGGGSRVVLRGIASLGGDNQPLFVVNGSPVSNSNISSGDRITGSYNTGNKAGQINPQNIASISVLKGAAAAALYGQRAKNGVILIETKKGTEGDANVTFSSSVTGSRPAVLPDFQNEYGPGNEGAYDEEDLNGWGPRMEGQQLPVYTGDTLSLTPAEGNVSDFYDTGVSYRNNIAFSNAGSLGDFRISLSTENTDGIVPQSELDRYRINTNAGTETLDGNLSARITANYVKEETVGRQAAGGNDPNILVGNINTVPRNLSADFLSDNFQNDLGEQVPIGVSTNNPYWIARKNQFTTDVERFFGNVQLSYEVFDWLTLQETLGTDIISERRRERNFKTTQQEERGAFTDDSFIEREIDHSFTVRTDNTFGDFSLKTILGNDINQRSFERDRVEASNLNIDGLWSPANANTTNPTNFFQRQRLISAYGSATVGFREYVFVQLTGRNDWSSTLPKENRSYFYPSASLSLVFTDLLEQEYDLNIPGLTYGKLRANYAEVGSDEDPYELAFTFEPVSEVFGQLGTPLAFPFGGQTGFEGPATRPPVDLKPQRKKEFEIGADLGFFDGRVTLDATYYNSETEDQILSLPVAQTTGFSFNRTNAGTLSNEGVELDLSVGIITRENFAWRATGNYSQNTNRVESLAEGVNEITIASGFNSLQVRARPGEELKLYGTGYERDPETGKVVIDPNTGLRRSGSDQALGELYPDFKVGLSNTFEIGNFNFSFLLDWKQGGNMFSQTVVDLRASGLAAETAENREGTFIDDGVIVTERDEEGNILETRPNDVPVQSMEDFWQQANDDTIIESGIFDASYVKLREVSLTYAFPQAWFNGSPISSGSVTVQGRNLLLLHSNVPHVDPETNLFGSGGNIGQGVEFNNVPNSSSLGVTFNLAF